MRLDDLRRSKNVEDRRPRNVTLVMPDGIVEVECPQDEYILDTVEAVGIDLPYTCRAGSCSACVGKVVSGKIVQDDQSFLTKEQMDDGYVCLCVAYPKSSEKIIIETHKEDELLSG